MNSTLKKLLFLFIILIGVIFFIEGNRKKPIDWRETYSKNDKIPYGTYILDQELDGLLHNDSVIRISDNIFEVLSNKLYDTLVPTNILSIKGNNYYDEFAAKHLSEYTEAGNNAIIIQSYFNYNILDTLGIFLEYNTPTLESNGLNDNEITLELTNKNLTTQKFNIKNDNYYYFLIPDKERDKIEVLGYKTINDKKLPNLIRIKQGKGSLILGLAPIIFTNYNLLESNNHLYAESVLSYLTNDKTYVFVDTVDDENESYNVLRYILQNDALRWAWYFFLISILVFVFFTAKRKQRIIPIITPLPNTTVDFTKTVSNLYIQNKDYHDIINKSIIYALEKIRRLYYIDTTKLDDKFVDSLHLKTKKDKEDIKKFVAFVDKFRASPNYASEDLLVTLNKIIEKILD